MEEKRDYRQQNNIQKFYFNDEGKLVVESNKGVWVDGEQHVKMYGNFSCNAKTMGIIIEKFKGFKVLIGKYLIDGKAQDATEIVNPDEIDKQYVKETTRLNERINEERQENANLSAKIICFNSLPWYKKMFKKIEA